jgi:polyisoprenoid-binding protein YceI
LNQAFAAALLLTAAAASASEPRVLSVVPAASTVAFHASHPMHQVDGTSRSVEGKAVIDADGAIKTMVRIAVQTFASGDSNRDSHMLETLEAGRHPYVVFKGLGTVGSQAAGGKPVEVRLRGELDFHGVKRPVEVPVQVQFAADGSARVTGRLVVSLEAYRIERPSLLMVKLDDTCTIDVDLKLGRSG